MRQTIAVALIALMAACDRGADGGDTTAAADAGMAGMTAMSGMGGTMSGAMMDSMAVYIRSMDTASSRGLQSMMPMHRQMAANMIARMNSEMGSMNMTAEAQWTALMDSVRQDLVRMPDMNGQQLKAFMPDHHDRLTRLTQSHRDMMKSMKM